MKNKKNISFRSLPQVSRPEKYKEYDNHEFVIALTDKASELKAFVAIHSTKLGFAHGGTRMKEYKDTAEAIEDVLDLSKAMSFKSALANLPYGGAKGVIMLPRLNYDRRKLLKAYAQKVQALSGLFRTGTDVGLTDADTAYMSKYTDYMLGIGSSDKGGLSTSKAAALGVYYAIKTAAKHKYGTEILDGKKICIKGIGKLGGELAHLVLNENVNLAVSDIDSMKVANFIKDFPDIKAVNHEEAHKQHVDIYAPCALGNEFNVKNISELNCDIIAGGANNQLVDDNAGDQLHKANILYVPDYIASAGGLIFVSDELEKDGFKISRVLKRLKGIQKTLEMVFIRSQRDNISTHRVADKIAEERISKVKP